MGVERPEPPTRARKDPPAPTPSSRSRLVVRGLLIELIWLPASSALAAVLLFYLHGEWQLLPSLGAGFLGGVVLRHLVRSNFARFPGFVRRNFEVGVSLLGVVLAAWATLALYPAPYWILKWRPALALLALAVLVGLALVSMRIQQARFERSIAEHRDRENALRQETLRSQLRVLQAQINPHFLFNALNALAELTRTDAEAAEELVQDLAHLLRYSLRSSSRERVSLSQEREAVERYLRVEMDWEDGQGELPVPGLLLQPLVENAVRHAARANTSCSPWRTTGPACRQSPRGSSGASRRGMGKATATRAWAWPTSGSASSWPTVARPRSICASPPGAAAGSRFDCLSDPMTREVAREDSSADRRRRSAGP